MTAVLEARGLRKVHGSGDAAVVALDDVDVALGHGEFLAVTGPSGCGKSTLLNLLGGLDRPTAGEIYLHGERVDSAGEARRARLRRSELGFVFQFFNLIDEPHGRPTTSSCRPCWPASPRARAPAAGELLERVGLGETPRACPASCRAASSSGSRSRARWSTGRACCWPTSPPATSTCAPPPRACSVLRERSDEGQAIVLVTHDLRVASAADRVLRMRDGAVVGESDLEGEADPEAALGRVLPLEG